jgi:hypothetical protein
VLDFNSLNIKVDYSAFEEGETGLVATHAKCPKFTVLSSSVSHRIILQCTTLEIIYPADSASVIALFLSSTNFLVSQNAKLLHDVFTYHVASKDTVCKLCLSDLQFGRDLVSDD